MAVRRARAAGSESHDQGLAEEAGARGEAGGVRIALLSEGPVRRLERRAPGAANELVAQIVSEVAERLISEAISRIKAAAARS